MIRRCQIISSITVIEFRKKRFSIVCHANRVFMHMRSVGLRSGCRCMNCTWALAICATCRYHWSATSWHFGDFICGRTSWNYCLQGCSANMEAADATLSSSRFGVNSHLHYSRLLCRSAWVGFSSQYVCLSVCLSVCPQHNSKTNDPKVFKLSTGNDLGVP